MPRIPQISEKDFGMSFNHDQVCNAAFLDIFSIFKKCFRFKDLTSCLKYDKNLPPKSILKKNYEEFEIPTSHFESKNEKEYFLPTFNENLTISYVKNDYDDINDVNFSTFSNQNSINTQNNEMKNENMIEQSQFPVTKVAQSIDADLLDTNTDEIFKDNALNFVTAFIKNENDLIQTNCNLDTGANISIVNINYLTSLPNCQIKTRNVNFPIYHVGANPTNISEIAEMTIVFIKNNVKIEVNHTFIVSTTCIYEVLLGNDFLRKVESIIKVGSFLEINQFYGQKGRSKYVKIPIFDYPTARQPFMVSMQHQKFKPFESKPIKCRLIQSGKIEPNETFLCETHSDSKLTVAETKVENSLFEYKTIIATNPFEKVLRIKPNSIIAKASPIVNSNKNVNSFSKKDKVACPVNYFKKTLKKLDKKNEQKASIEEAKKLLDKDIYMSEDEKEKALDEFKKTGMLELSTSHLVNQ